MIEWLNQVKIFRKFAKNCLEVSVLKETFILKVKDRFVLKLSNITLQYRYPKPHIIVI